MSSLNPVRGMRDLFGSELAIHRYIESISEKNAISYDYEPIEIPIVEKLSTFEKSLGKSSDVIGKEMYTFQDRNDATLALRPEGTASVIRACLSLKLNLSRPQKLFYKGPMFRYERPQKGRYRQFYQFGIEYLGESHHLSDVDVISLAFNILKDLEVEIILHINTIGDQESRETYKKSLINYLSQHLDKLSSLSKERLYYNPLRILDSKDKNDREICKEAPLFEDYLKQEDKENFSLICKALDTLNIPYIHDQYLVRGLDYYTNTVFEFKTTKLGSQDAIIAGGRYNDLIQHMGGPKIPGIGWALGIDRLSCLTEFTNSKKRIAFIVIGEHLLLKGLELVQKLRHNGIITDIICNNSLTKSLKQAHKRDFNYAILFGNNEFSAKTVKIRNLKDEKQSSNKEIMVSYDKIISFFKSIK
ncbi:MAG: histidine--tRNA ligase [Alphaproteobacteria bacterium]